MLVLVYHFNIQLASRLENPLYESSGSWSLPRGVAQITGLNPT